VCKCLNMHAYIFECMCVFVNGVLCVNVCVCESAWECVGMYVHLNVCKCMCMINVCWCNFNYGVCILIMIMSVLIYEYVCI